MIKDLFFILAWIIIAPVITLAIIGLVCLSLYVYREFGDTAFILFVAGLIGAGIGYMNRPSQLM